MLTLCWDCSMASKYLIICLLKSLAFCFWKKKERGCRQVYWFWAKVMKLKTKWETGLEIVKLIIFFILLVHVVSQSRSRTGLSFRDNVNANVSQSEEAVLLFWIKPKRRMCCWLWAQYLVSSAPSQLLCRRSNYLGQIFWLPWLETRAPCQRHKKKV